MSASLACIFLCHLHPCRRTVRVADTFWTIFAMTLLKRNMAYSNWYRDVWFCVIFIYFCWYVVIYIDLQWRRTRSCLPGVDPYSRWAVPNDSCSIACDVSPCLDWSGRWVAMQKKGGLCYPVNSHKMAGKSTIFDQMAMLVYRRVCYH